LNFKSFKDQQKYSYALDLVIKEALSSKVYVKENLCN